MAVLLVTTHIYIYIANEKKNLINRKFIGIKKMR